MAKTRGGAMLGNQCPRCGRLAAASDRFCGDCGAGLAPASYPYYPYYPTAGPAPTNHTALIVAVVLIVVVVLVVLPALLYVVVSGLITPIAPGPPKSLGVVISRSTDGSTWILIFTSVPTGLGQNDTMLSVASAGGAALLAPTSLYHLEGSGLVGVRYAPYQTGPAFTACAAGDQIFLAAGSGANQYPAGTQATIVNRGSILFLAALQ